MFGLTEAIMEWFGFDTIHYFNHGNIFLGASSLKFAFDPRTSWEDTTIFLRYTFRRERAFGCGTWTGPENDLLCVKRCRTNEEAKKFLSPLASTPFGAAVAAAAKSIMLGRFRRVTLGTVEVGGKRMCGMCGWRFNSGEQPEFTDSYENPGFKEVHCPACGHWLDTEEGGA